MIVVFGSLNVDLVSEMAAVPQTGQTILADAFRIEAGGKGANQALAAARAGAKVAMVGAVGRDALATVALSGLQSAGVDISRVAAVASPTGCAAIWVERDGANRIVVAAGANACARSEMIDDGLLSRASCVLLQMETPASEVSVVIARCRAKGVRSILNLAPALPLDRDVLGQCGLLVVNEDEAATLAGWIGSAADARAIRASIGVDVVRTLGAAGSEAAIAEGTWHVPAVATSVKDTTAAGDCYIGVLGAGLDRGLGLRDAMIEASVAASLACARTGSQASLPTRIEIDRARAVDDRSDQRF